MGKIERKWLKLGTYPGFFIASIGKIGALICSDLNWGDSCVRPLVGTVDLLLLPMAQGSTRQLYKQVLSREQRSGEPLLADYVRTVGAPAVSAGLIGPFSVGSPSAGDYLRGGTHLIDPNGRKLAGVGFDRQGVAVATVTLGNVGGNPEGRLLHDPER